MNLTEYQNYHESKSHTSLEFPYNTYLCCIPMDFTHVPIHWHNEMECHPERQWNHFRRLYYP